MQPENDLIVLEITKEVTTLFKYYLQLIENLDIPQEQKITYRKFILDNSNDTIRNLINYFGYFDFTINKDKVESAAKKIIVKKFMINSVVSVQ